MIIDVHSHAWPFPEAFSEDFIRQASGAKADTTIDISVRYEDYRSTAPDNTKTVVFGGKAKLSGAICPYCSTLCCISRRSLRRTFSRPRACKHPQWS
jgi:hypothetical protein